MLVVTKSLMHSYSLKTSLIIISKIQNQTNLVLLSLYPSSRYKPARYSRVPLYINFFYFLSVVGRLQLVVDKNITRGRFIKCEHDVVNKTAR